MMREVIPYVTEQLPSLLHKHGILSSPDPMPVRAPLEISEAKMVSYKEAWNPTNCALSLKKSSLYEAGGNLCWIDGEVVGARLPFEDPPFSWLQEFDQVGFVEESGRLRFPTVMECYMMQEPEPDAFPKHLFPLSGHSYIYAWYYSCWVALLASDADRCQKLFEAALCTTICVRVLGVGSSGGLAAMAELSNRFAERLRAETKVAMDSFVTFADKVWLMSGDKTPDLQTISPRACASTAALST